MNLKILLIDPPTILFAATIFKAFETKMLRWTFKSNNT
jgi:hypothetical protein